MHNDLYEHTLLNTWLYTHSCIDIYHSCILQQYSITPQSVSGSSGSYSKKKLMGEKQARPSMSHPTAVLISAIHFDGLPGEGGVFGVAGACLTFGAEKIAWVELCSSQIYDRIVSRETI